MHRTASLLSLATACALMLADARDSAACGNAIYLETNEANRLIAQAEKALDKGRYREVRELLSEDMIIRNKRLRERRLELVSVAYIRTGYITRGVHTLRRLLRDRPDDPYLQTRLAEGLSRLKKGKTEALRILERLEKADLVADAEGYAVLSELRRRKGDSKGQSLARERCLKVAKDPTTCPDEVPFEAQSRS